MNEREIGVKLDRVGWVGLYRNAKAVEGYDIATLQTTSNGVEFG